MPLDLKAGDRVLFGKWSGSEVKIDDEDLLIMKESDIMGVIEAPAHSTKRRPKPHRVPPTERKENMAAKEINSRPVHATGAARYRYTNNAVKVSSGPRARNVVIENPSVLRGSRRTA